MFKILHKINPFEPITVTFRRVKDINVDDFTEDLIQSAALNDTSKPVEELVKNYNTELNRLLDKHAPLCTKTITLRPNTSWFTPELRDAKHQKRKMERKWRSSKLVVHLELYREQCLIYNELLHKSKIDF